MIFTRNLIGSLIGLSLVACQVSEPETRESAPEPEPEKVEMAAPLEPISPEDQKQAAELRVAGLQMRGQGDLSTAIATFQESVELDPDNLSGQRLLGWTLHLAGQEAEAEKVLSKASLANPEDVETLNALGIVYLFQGELDAAIAELKAAIEVDPENEIGHYNLSLAYQRIGDLENAIAHGETATILEPDNPHPWVALGLAHWSRGDTEQAQIIYLNAVQLDARYGQISYLPNLKVAGFSDSQIAEIDALLRTLF